MGITAQFLKFALLGAEWVMYVLVACSVLSLSIIVERIFFFARMRGDFAEFMTELHRRLNQDPADKTAAWCAGQSLLEARIAAVGLESVPTRDAKTAEDSMTAALITAKVKMEKGLTILGTLGNNTPFVGLFGTIIGIIQAFHALAGNSGSGPEVVMAAIAEALVATAVGLMVAIPAVAGFNFIGRVIKTKMANGEATVRIVLSYLNRTALPEPQE